MPLFRLQPNNPNQSSPHQWSMWTDQLVFYVWATNLADSFYSVCFLLNLFFGSFWVGILSSLSSLFCSTRNWMHCTRYFYNHCVGHAQGLALYFDLPVRCTNYMALMKICSFHWILALTISPNKFSIQVSERILLLIFFFFIHSSFFFSSLDSIPLLFLVVVVVFVAVFSLLMCPIPMQFVRFVQFYKWKLHYFFVLLLFSVEYALRIKRANDIKKVSWMLIEK